MKGFAFVIFAVGLMICHVDGFYLYQCKDAEKSDDTLMKLVENANCTITEGTKMLREGLNLIQAKLNYKMKYFYNHDKIRATSIEDATENLLEASPVAEALESRHIRKCRDTEDENSENVESETQGEVIIN